MKKLILAFLVISNSVLANEITDDEITKRHLSLIKDAEVEQMLDNTPEFINCKTDYKFDGKDDDAKKDIKLKKATECFQKQLASKDTATLKKLAEDLNLESYGLIKNKTSIEITNYLSKKITKSLTGQDPDEKDPKKIMAALKWENQKIVDQRVFLDLYKNQLVKSALFEVSRFCYEDLEIDGIPKTDKSFEAYWKGHINFTTDNKANTTGITDIGSTRFTTLSQVKDINDKKEVYQVILKGITGTKIDTQTHQQFLKFCQSSIKVLCDEFKESKTSDSNSIAKDAVTKMTKGANSCLTMSKLESIKSGLKKSELVAKQFDEMGPDKGDIAVKMITDAQMYQGGKGKDEESLDDISNMTSADMLASQGQNDLQDLEKKCAIPGAKDPVCDEFLVKSDGLDKAIHNVEYQMNLKREVEVARVKDLKKNKTITELEDYLKENNLYDVLEKVQKKNITDAELEEEIRKIYDSRKVAEIEALKLKVGKRQLSEDEYNKKTETEKAGMIKNNITDAKEERARLAQVVLFNNIITSQLELQEEGGKSLGRNVGAWNKEAADLQGSGNLENMDLFKMVQDEADKHGSKSEDTSIGGSGIIDMILGKKD